MGLTVPLCVIEVNALHPKPQATRSNISSNREHSSLSMVDQQNCRIQFSYASAETYSENGGQLRTGVEKKGPDCK